MNPEKTKKAKAIIKYEEYKSSKRKKHKIKRNGHVEPWKGWAKENRLEVAWDKKLKGKRSETPFAVEEKAVGSGSGNTEVGWTVWDASEKLTNLEVEHYAVMRAENRYIKEGFTKTASKYAATFHRRSKKGKAYSFKVENLGIDNFFVKGNEYVFCESKFTRNEGKFDEWKKDPKKVWSLMGRYSANGNRCRQMSWKWIKDRADKAAKDPSGLVKKEETDGGVEAKKVSRGEKRKIKTEAADMKVAADGGTGKRIVNIYGASEVPVYPGEYRFISSEMVQSANVLKVEWPISVNEQEFIELGEDFDEWVGERENKMSSKEV